jgi:NADPH:quinone reductase
MRAWQVEAITEAGILRLCDIAIPEHQPGQYLVRVEAAGLNFLDTLIVRGQYQVKPPLPFVPGGEVIGRIIEGDGPLPIGTRVAATVRLIGGFAEYALVQHANAVAVSEELSPAVAMSLRGNYPTSLYALRDRASLRSGETLLVHAGAGGVGSAAIQLGKKFGARVIATAGGSSKVDACHVLGADSAIDYRDNDWVAEVKRLAPDGADVIYDPVGGEVGAQSMRLLAFGGRYLVIGFAGGTLTQLAANRLLLQNASAVGVLWGVVRARDPQLAADITNEVSSWYREGLLKPLSGTTFPFNNAPEALEALRGRSTTGKVLLQI